MSKDIVSGLDYAIANLETTFGGDDYPIRAIRFQTVPTR